MSRSLNVVITGGSSGIGRSIVQRFASGGNRVFTTYNSNASGVESLKMQYPKLVDYCFLDQGDINSIGEFRNKVQDWLARDLINGGRIDVLINNAALGSATVKSYIRAKIEKLQGGIPFLNPDPTTNPGSAWIIQTMEDEALMKVNALGPMWITEVLMPLMRTTINPALAKRDASARNYSTILFIGSVGGGVAVFPEYRASDLMSKAAVSYLSKHLAAEQIKSNVDVFCLAPGATLTDMFRRSTLDHIVNQSAFTQQLPKQRLLDPEEIAEGVFQLTTNRWARMFHGDVMDASLGLGTLPGLQTENNSRT